MSNPTETTVIDGMELTEAEAKLAAEPIDAVDPKLMADGQSPADVLGTADPTAANVAEAPAQAAAPVEAQAPTPVAEVPLPAIPPAPTAPIDFDAAAREIQDKYDAGDLTSDEFAAQTREIARKEAAFTAQQAIHEQHVAAAKAATDAAWNAAALDWERKNADFMSNPIRQQAMRDAIAHVDKESSYTLHPAELLQRAEKIAFEAYGYKRVDTDAAAAAAVRQRAPDVSGVPASLGSAPNAGSEDIRGNETFNALDRMSVDDLEDALAKMPQAQREAYLFDAPGARATGRE